jgi:hypothetical protein
VHGRVAVPGPADLAVPHQAVAVEPPDGAGGDVERRALPVADDVGLLDGDLADLGPLLGGHHLVDRSRVGQDQGPRRQALQLLVHGGIQR